MNNNLEEFTNFNICYSVAKILNLELMYTSTVNTNWYKYKLDNKQYHIKYTSNINNISFSSFNELITYDHLVIIYLDVNKYKYIITSIKNQIKLSSDSKGYFKMQKNSFVFYPKNKITLELSFVNKSQTYQLSMCKLQCSNTIALTIDRYNSIIERSYLNKLKYFLFEILNKSKMIDTIDTSNYIPDDIINKKYKALYNNMKLIRERNKQSNIIKKKFKDIIKNDKVKYIEYYIENKLSFNSFYEFWNPKSERNCKYCGINEKQITSNNLEIKTKRFYSRGKTMEIDKINAFDDYTKNNIILACYWCNNAKTDEFSLCEFKNIAKAINIVWNKRLTNCIINFPNETYKDCINKDKE
ncbi:MAG: hypothetical protein DRG78_00095 [Epsilonproteobacteria bacterium]|nr:MAG: hypothetical protein DRG78_00095 [Campylobacterota bacterium]